VVAYAKAKVPQPRQSESLLCLDELRCTSGAGIGGRKFSMVERFWDCLVRPEYASGLAKHS
jgi:hypothetical protein